MAEIKERYETLKKKFSLPAYQELNRKFDIEDVDSKTELLLIKIKAKMHEKIEAYAKLFENMLQPDNSLSGLYEARYITEEERKKAFTLFKRLMSILRYSNLVSVNNDDEENADFIKKAFDDLTEMNSDIELLIKRLKEVWGTETNIAEDLSYFG
jgi:hypothetical protein